MKVLVITYYWPPSGGSGVQRWLKLSKYLPRFGWEPVIYTPLNPDVNATDESLLKDVSKDLEVIKKKITEPYGLYKILSGKKKGEQLRANIITAEKNSGVEKRGVFQRMSMHIRANWFIPDPRCWWIKPSVRFLSKIIKSRKIDAVISTGPPHSMHLIAKQLHRKFNLPWIADFRDPWTNIFYFKHLGLSERSLKKHKALERSVLAEADLVTVVSPQMEKEFSEGGYIAFKDKVKVIPNGYDPDDFEGVSEAGGADGKFVVAHTGLMPQSANPDVFWKVLGDMVKTDPLLGEKLSIVVMGQTDPVVRTDIAENGLEGYFKDLGYVPHATSVAWQKRANLLLLPLRKEKESKAILTGKFFEYLASGNRILAFGPADGNLALELEATGSGNICDFEDKVAIKNCFSDIWNKFKNGADIKSNLTQEQKEKRLKYSRIKQAEKFSHLLNECVNNR